MLLSKARIVAQLILQIGLELELVTDDVGDQAEQPPPTPITAANGKGKGKAAKAPLDTAANAGAAPPAPPSAAQPTGKTMVPLCKDHADLADRSKVTPIPADPTGCVRCGENVDKATAKKPAGGKAMSYEEAKTVAEALMDARKDGGNVCFGILAALGAESLSGAEGSIALDPAHYEEFAKQCLAAMPAPAVPARRSL